MMKLYGVPGWGSAISEMMLTLADIPYQFINVDGFDQPGAQREKLLAINPLCQVPTLLLVDGSIMTETAAIALMILDKRPDHNASSFNVCLSGWWQTFILPSPTPTIPNAGRSQRLTNCVRAVSNTANHSIYGWNNS